MTRMSADYHVKHENSSRVPHNSSRVPHVRTHYLKSLRIVWPVLACLSRFRSRGPAARIINGQVADISHATEHVIVTASRTTPL